MKKSTLQPLNHLRYLVIISLFISGCAAQQTVSSSPNRWLQHHGLAPPTVGQPVQLCTNFGCETKGFASFSNADLLSITALFNAQNMTAVEERESISKATGMMETITGPELNTLYDQPANEFSLFGKGNQLDCIAESGNSSAYLLLIEQLNLLRHHTVTGIAHRGLFTLNAPHNSASIQETSSGQYFVVDSWFSANGKPAWVTPLAVWETGARPKNE